MSNPIEQRLWALYSEQIKADVAKAPELSPTQIREIRAIWLGIITRKAAQ